MVFYCLSFVQSASKQKGQSIFDNSILGCTHHKIISKIIVTALSKFVSHSYSSILTQILASGFFIMDLTVCFHFFKNKPRNGNLRDIDRHIFC